MRRSAKVLLLMPAARHRALIYAGAASLLTHLALVGITRSSALMQARPELRAPTDTWAGDSPLSGDLIEVGTTDAAPASPTPLPSPLTPLPSPPTPLPSPPTPLPSPPTPLPSPPTPLPSPPTSRPSSPTSRPSSPTPRPSPPTLASASNSTASGPAGGQSGPSGSFGAAGEQKARSLGRAFTRALPAACVADARWAKLTPGDVGVVTVRVALDAAGKIASHSFVEPEPPPQLVRSVERALGMLRAGTFMPQTSGDGAGEDTLRLRAKVVDGEAPTESAGTIALKQSWDNSRGTASFTQSTGRTVEFVIERVKTD